MVTVSVIVHMIGNGGTHSIIYISLVLRECQFANYDLFKGQFNELLSIKNRVLLAANQARIEDGLKSRTRQIGYNQSQHCNFFYK